MIKPTCFYLGLPDGYLKCDANADKLENIYMVLYLVFSDPLFQYRKNQTDVKNGMALLYVCFLVKIAHL